MLADSGIYTWDYLYKLGREQATLPGAASKPHACGHHH
jgi:DUF971 family protein